MTVAAASAPAQDVVLIDLSALYAAAFHAAADQSLSVAFQATLDGVRRCVNYRQGALVAVCCDGKGNWRKKLDPTYKANREQKPAAYYDQFDRVKERLRADGLLLWECPGFEADDLIATAVDGAVTNGHAVVVCSADKDLAQLLQHSGVTMLRTSTWEPFDANNARDKFGVPPNKLRDWLAIVGDTSDNVPGVAGFGPKTAAELLTAHETIDGIYDAMAAGTVAVKGKKLETLQASIERLDLSRKLVTLRYDAPIEFAEIYDERKPQPLAKEIPPMPDAVDAEFNDNEISRPPARAAEQIPLGRAAATPSEGKTTESNGAAKGGGTNGVPAVVPSIGAMVAAGPSDSAASSPQSQALVVRAEPVKFELALEPQSPGQAVNLAARLHKARLYTWLANEDQVLAVIMRGREVGLPAGAALDVFRPVEGRLAAIWQFIVDRAQNDPTCEYIAPVTVSDTAATWEAKRRGHPKPFSLTVTIDEMRKTGLVKEEKKQSAWMARPSQMLSKECAVRLARMLWPGSTSGLYALHELGGEE